MGQKKTTTETPSYSADQTQVQSLLADYLKTSLTNPSSQTQPLKTAAVGRVNQNYAGLTDRLNSQFSARGFGGSGKANLNTTKLELGRQSALGGLESQFAGLDLDQQNRNLSLAETFGFTNPTRTSVSQTSGLAGLTSSAALLFSLAGGGKLFSGLFGGGSGSGGGSASDGGSSSSFDELGIFGG